MGRFLALLTESMQLASAALSQQFVRDHFSQACEGSGMRFWKCSAIAPDLSGRSLFLGIADYDRRDLELLDTLSAKVDELELEFGPVHVFLLADCERIEDIQGILPDIANYPAQNPLVSLWVRNACVFTAGGYAAARWLLEKVEEPA
jgi:hypothetical protein